MKQEYHRPASELPPPPSYESVVGQNQNQYHAESSRSAAARPTEQFKQAPIMAIPFIKNKYLRAYAPFLEQYGIRQDEFVRFIDSINFAPSSQARIDRLVDYNDRFLLSKGLMGRFVPIKDLCSLLRIPYSDKMEMNSIEQHTTPVNIIKRDHNGNNFVYRPPQTKAEKKHRKKLRRIQKRQNREAKRRLRREKRRVRREEKRRIDANMKIIRKRIEENEKMQSKIYKRLEKDLYQLDKQHSSGSRTAYTEKFLAMKKEREAQADGEILELDRQKKTLYMDLNHMKNERRKCRSSSSPSEEEQGEMAAELATSGIFSGDHDSHSDNDSYSDSDDDDDSDSDDDDDDDDDDDFFFGIGIEDIIFDVLEEVFEDDKKKSKNKIPQDWLVVTSVNNLVH